MWNGTAATLNPNPTSTSARPRSSIGLRSSERERTCVAIWVKLVVPVAPYTSAMPYSRNPEANAPSRKYLSAASAAAPLLRSIPASTYTATDISSSPRKITIRSSPPAISIMPRVANNSRT